MSGFCGIDPGLCGAIAFLQPDSTFQQVLDLPIIRDGRLAWVDGGVLQSLLIDSQPDVVIVERVSAMPRQGVASSFNFGVGLGSILGLIQARELRLELVTARVWKRDLKLSSDKHASLDKARLLYPGAELLRKKDEGRAEALLLAYWGWRRQLAHVLGAQELA